MKDLVAFYFQSYISLILTNEQPRCPSETSYFQSYISLILTRQVKVQERGGEAGFQSYISLILTGKEDRVRAGGRGFQSYISLILTLSAGITSAIQEITFNPTLV